MHAARELKIICWFHQYVDSSDSRLLRHVYMESMQLEQYRVQ